eukprot:CAMPEP_0118909694 /NCGR_PEP_ID=MMETSP1166-20130328/12160_1 /TAXON_ID=1104430 /ORGANISM="Chrysoreinhardia sp, Strain CCMP3193" /LENGTH=560 /DNA_ID=CAMNT_0006849139 /DNA_START=77 /DNA_END=1755 /DNA_ORIENTATION=+
MRLLGRSKSKKQESPVAEPPANPSEVVVGEQPTTVFIPVARRVASTAMGRSSPLAEAEVVRETFTVVVELEASAEAFSLVAPLIVDAIADACGDWESAGWVSRTPPEVRPGESMLVSTALGTLRRGAANVAFDLEKDKAAELVERINAETPRRIQSSTRCSARFRPSVAGEGADVFDPSRSDERPRSQELLSLVTVNQLNDPRGLAPGGRFDDDQGPPSTGPFRVHDGAAMREEAIFHADGHGGWSPAMRPYLQIAGRVVRVLASGDVVLHFLDGQRFRVGTRAIQKLEAPPTEPRLGTRVEVLENPFQVEELQKRRCGYDPRMRDYGGKRGRVTETQLNGDVVVAFHDDDVAFVFSPVCVFVVVQDQDETQDDDDDAAFHLPEVEAQRPAVVTPQRQQLIASIARHFDDTDATPASFAERARNLGLDQPPPWLAGKIFHWQHAETREQRGPDSLDTFTAQYVEGETDDSCLVWADGLADPPDEWTEIANVPELRCYLRAVAAIRINEEELRKATAAAAAATPAAAAASRRNAARAADARKRVDDRPGRRAAAAAAAPEL